VIHVISTTYAAPEKARSRCLDSVAVQDCPHVHHYIDALEQTPPRSHFENLITTIAPLADDDIVASVDGDDWLAVGGALEIVQRAHDRGALVTYGSFRHADGRPGFARQLQGPPREQPWVTTHLKSFRAGLFKKIDHEHLKYCGRWLEHARDLALMYPLLEMAGSRAVFVPEVIYVYNYGNSTEFNGNATTLAQEREQVAYVRSLPEYQCTT